MSNAFQSTLEVEISDVRTLQTTHILIYDFSSLRKKMSQNNQEQNQPQVSIYEKIGKIEKIFKVKRKHFAIGKTGCVEDFYAGLCLISLNDTKLLKCS